MENPEKLLKSIALFSVVCGFYVLVSCSGNSRAQDQLNKLQWLVGSWQMKTESGLLTETWKALPNGNLAGESYLIGEKSDTLFAEKVRLEEEEGEVYYKVRVPNQNNAETVPFKLLSVTENSVTFENKDHDFPQRIVYKKGTNNTMVARIEGKQNGKAASQEFPMKRVE